MCTDEWTGRYCDKRKPEVFSDASMISSDDETNAKDDIITPSNCSRFLMSFEIDNNVFEKVRFHRLYTFYDLYFTYCMIIIVINKNR